TARGAHHCQRDAGIAGGRLDHRLPGLQRAALLGVEDHRDRRRSLTEPPGLNDSTLAYNETCGGARRCSLMIGVPPMVSRMLSCRGMASLVQCREGTTA